MMKSSSTKPSRMSQWKTLFQIFPVAIYNTNTFEYLIGQPVFVSPKDLDEGTQSQNCYVRICLSASLNSMSAPKPTLTMDNSSRQRKLRMATGRLLALPIFASNVLMSHGRGIDRAVEDVFSNVFLKKSRTTLVLTKKTDDSCRILNALTVLLELGYEGKQDPIDSHRIGGSRDTLSYARRFEEMMVTLLNVFIIDLCDVFQVEITDLNHLRVLYNEGVTLLRMLNIIGNSGTISIFPVGFVAALACATTMAGRLLLHHKYEDDNRLISDWVDKILRVWLQILDASVVSCESNATLIRREGSVEFWVAYILAARNVFNGIRSYFKTPTFDLGLNRDLQDLTFDDVEYEDITSIHSVMCSMQRENVKMLEEYFYPFVSDSLFQSEQVRSIATFLSEKVRREASSGSKGEENERMRNIIEGAIWLLTGCIRSRQNWITADLEKYELDFRIDRFEREDVYAITIRSMLSVVVALLLSTDYFSVLYEEVINDIVENNLEKELRT